MSFTRFHDDPARISKSVEESSYSGRYYLNTPGQGVNLPFSEEPSLRLQGWGSNLTTNTVNLESDLKGLTRRICHDEVDVNEYTRHKVETKPFIYSSIKPFVEESRASHPVWMYKDLEQTRWEYPWINPQDNVEQPFSWNVQTRILEKDSFSPQLPNVHSHENANLYGGI